MRLVEATLSGFLKKHRRLENSLNLLSDQHILDKIDQLLSILHEADPLEETDPPFLPQLEDQVR